MIPRHWSIPFLVLALAAVSACGPSESELQTATAQMAQVVQSSIAETLTAEPTDTPLPTFTSSPTSTITPTSTLTQTATLTATSTPTFTPTFTPVPQYLMLRSICGTSYTVYSGIPIVLYYGGWAVKGSDLAQQWSTNLVESLSIDGVAYNGYLQPYSKNLPYNCKSSTTTDLYYLYSVAFIQELAPGSHTVKVTIKAISALSDGEKTYGPGVIYEQDFTITSK